MSRPRVAPTAVSVGEIAMEVVHAASDPKLVAFGSALPDLRPRRAPRRAAADDRRDARATGRARSPTRCRPATASCACRSRGAASTPGCAFGPTTWWSRAAARRRWSSVSARSRARATRSPSSRRPSTERCRRSARSACARSRSRPTPRPGSASSRSRWRSSSSRSQGLVVTPHASNPLGYVMPDERKVALLRLLEAHDVPLIEDDIYGELVYGSPRPRAIKSWDTRRPGAPLLVGVEVDRAGAARRLGGARSLGRARSTI